jgi:hypothetical protein
MIKIPQKSSETVKDKQYNDQKKKHKKTNNDPYNIKQRILSKTANPTTNRG